MSDKQLPVQDLELVYDALAEAINRVGEEKEALFLTKLTLLLANQLGDSAQFETALTTAQENL